MFNISTSLSFTYDFTVCDFSFVHYLEWNLYTNYTRLGGWFQYCNTCVLAVCITRHSVPNALFRTRQWFVCLNFCIIHVCSKCLFYHHCFVNGKLHWSPNGPQLHSKLNRTRIYFHLYSNKKLDAYLKFNNFFAESYSQETNSYPKDTAR